jgi:hypothetical protein
MNNEETFGQPLPQGTINVAYTGTAGTTAALNSLAQAVRLVATTDCFVEISVAGTAALADSGFYLPAFTPEYFTCLPGSKVSAIQVASGGTIYATAFA